MKNMTVQRIWYMNMSRAVRQVVAGLVLFMLAAAPALAQNTLSTLLPDGKQQFLDGNGNPLASGKVFMYVPSTTTFKNTWQDSGQVTLNTNPIILDASGRAVIYGTGVYRQLVQTSASVLVYDALTSATNVATVLSFIGGTSTNSANVQQVTTAETAGFALANKPTVYFNPGFVNTAAMTLNVNASGAKNVFRPSFSGPVALTGGEIRTGQLAQVTYDGTQWILTVDTPYLGISTSLSSAGTTDLGTVASHVVQVTGTTGITAFGSTASADFPVYLLRFSGALTLTYNATSLILPGAANITTAANDTATAQYLGSGNWQITQYQRASVALFTATAPTVQTFTSGSAATYTAAAGVVRQRVRMIAGGGGGGAQITNAGTAGVTTSFQVNGSGTAWGVSGGFGGAIGANNGAAGGAGGTGGTDGSTGTKIVRIAGSKGGTGAGGSGAGNVIGGPGGNSLFGGAGQSTTSGGGAPTAATANTGSGGAGIGTTNGTSSAGGGAGEYLEFWVSGMTTAIYTVGAGGAGGVAGTLAGGAGAAGIVIIEEFYNKFLRSICEAANDNNQFFEECKAV